MAVEGGSREHRERVAGEDAEWCGEGRRGGRVGDDRARRHVDDPPLVRGVPGRDDRHAVAGQDEVGASDAEAAERRAAGEVDPTGAAPVDDEQHLAADVELGCTVDGSFPDHGGALEIDGLHGRTASGRRAADTVARGHGVRLTTADADRDQSHLRRRRSGCADAAAERQAPDLRARLAIQRDQPSRRDDHDVVAVLPYPRRIPAHPVRAHSHLGRLPGSEHGCRRLGRGRGRGRFRRRGLGLGRSVRAATDERHEGGGQRGGVRTSHPPPPPSRPEG